MSSVYKFNGKSTDLIFGCFKTTRENQFITHRKKYDVHLFTIDEVSDDGIIIKCILDDTKDVIPFDDIISLKNHNTNESIIVDKYISLENDSISLIASTCYSDANTGIKMYTLTDDIFNEIKINSVSIESGNVKIKQETGEDITSLSSIYILDNSTKY